MTLRISAAKIVDKCLTKLLDVATPSLWCGLPNFTSFKVEFPFEFSSTFSLELEQFTRNYCRNTNWITNEHNAKHSILLSHAIRIRLVCASHLWKSCVSFIFLLAKPVNVCKCIQFNQIEWFCAGIFIRVNPNSMNELNDWLCNCDSNTNKHARTSGESDDKLSKSLLLLFLVLNWLRKSAVQRVNMFHDFNPFHQLCAESWEFGSIRKLCVERFSFAANSPNVKLLQ